MAENSVYSNEDGIVMFGQGGQVFKVPYEFGNGLALGNFDNPIVINNLNLNIDNFTLGYWIQRIPSTATGYLDINYIRLLLDNGYESYISHRTGDQTVRFYPRISNPGSIRAVPSGRFEAYIIEDKNVIGCYNSNEIRYYDTTNVVDNSNANYISRISLNYFTSTPSCDPRVNRLYDELIVFDRHLSLNEYRYINNNSNGNPPLTRDGLFIYLKLDRAEILTIGGADKIGVRDYSGNNRHGEITNLPAGTIQEQLDWANSNLFVPFIS